MAKKSMTALVVFGVIALIAILGLLSYAVVFKAVTPQTTISTSTTTTPSGGVAGTGCSQNPSVTITGVDKLIPGTTQTISPQFRVNGLYVGANPTFQVGQSVEYLVNGTTPIDMIATPFTVACGPNPITVEVPTYANATITIKNNAGTQILSNNVAGATINETNISAGGSKNWEISLQGNNQKSSGKTLHVLELPANSGYNVSANGISMSCGGVSLPQVAIPSGVTVNNANSVRAAFEIDAIDGNVKKVCNLQVSTLASKTLSGGVYNTFYAEQAFVDVDGTFKVGVYDANGNAKFQDKQSYNFIMYE